MAPIVLETEVHCLGCAKKMKKAIEKMPGVERVSTSAETGTVVVAGTADAEALRRRIQQRMRRHVKILNDGTEAAENQNRWHGQGHGTPPGTPPRWYGWGTSTSAARQLRHHALPQLPAPGDDGQYGHGGGNDPASRHRRNTCLDDEHYHTAGDDCCSVQ